MNRRLELKTELLTMEGAGFSRQEIVEELHNKFHVAPETVQYYYRSRHQWQPAILGLEDAKEGYHQTLNRLEYIYRKFSAILLSASEDSNKIGALKGMLETTLKKAELTGVLVQGVASDDKPTFQSLIDQEVMEHLTPNEEAIVMHAAELFMNKRRELMSLRKQEAPLR